ncbi:type II toxin-antitoxin system VapC family toxin [Rhizobium sp. RU33A]|uniref:type II toxin-antitoxin system VapC family toxin n=1 Tax=Rhizobium sp. RU33A TaxID=1907413 RepID=UPI0032AFEE8C
MAILKTETAAAECEAILSDGSRRLLVPAAILTEAHIVAARNQRLAEMKILITASGIEIIPLTSARAEVAAAAYQRFGKGFTPQRSTSVIASPMPPPRSSTVLFCI